MTVLNSLKTKLSSESKKKQEDDFITAFKESNFEESGLNSQLDKVAKYIDSISKADLSLGKIPEGYKSVGRYPLLPPFCYVSILQNNEFSDLIYNIDELQLNEEEIKIYYSIKELLEKNIDSPRLLDNIDASFTSEITRLVKDH